MRRCLGCMEEYKDEYQICPKCGYEDGTPPAEAYHIVPGTILGERYLVGRVLGFGGFGVTYIGYDLTLDRKVALKEYLPSEFSTRLPGQTEVITYAGEKTEQFQSGLGKFVEEAKMLAQFQAADGVVQIYDSFCENSTAYIVMEYMDGRTLKNYLEEKGRISVEEAKEILRPVAASLKEIHKLGVLHRDIAPDNIMLTTDGQVKLFDFGASRFATTSHSKSLSVIIKQGYTPVEQYRSRGDQGPWTDVYSLAATFYKMITGVTPEDSMERVEKEELRKPSKMGISIPKNTENAIMNALVVNPRERTQSIEAFEEELYGEGKVRRKLVHMRKADVGKWPVWMKLASAAASLAVIVFAMLLFTGVIDYSRLIPEGFALPEGKTRVPNLVNRDLDSGRDMMEEARLFLQITDKQYSEHVASDIVLSQNVKSGKIIEMDNIVEIVVSAGKEPVSMPDVLGLSRQEAVDSLEMLGFRVSIEEVYCALEQDVVQGQGLAPGDSAFRGDEILLRVSKGTDSYIDKSQELEVPDFVGMTWEELLSAAKDCGVTIRKTEVKTGNGDPGTVQGQTPSAGERCHQGDIIEIVLWGSEVQYCMPDVQYKDEKEALEKLEIFGLEVAIEYEENSLVEKGRVISQSIAAQTLVKSGDKVTLVVSLGTEQINQLAALWSEWSEELPADIKKSKYEIEEKKQYSFRDLSTTISLSSVMEGWELYDQKTEKNVYGDWSEWSESKPAAAENREIDSKTLYSYRDRQTTVSDQAGLSGWTQIGDPFYGEEYGDWSSWSEAAVSGSETRKVEKKTQYRSRTMETTTADTGSLDGWIYDGNRTETAGGWSEYSETPVSEEDNGSFRIEVQTEQRTESVYVKTMYLHFRYEFFNKNTQTRWDTYSESFANNLNDYSKYAAPQYYTMELDHIGPLPQNENKGEYVGEDAWWYAGSSRDIYEDRTVTVYRSRRIDYTYHFFRYGAWSDWTENVLNAQDGLEVEARELYRYSDKIPYYNYEKMSDWSAYSDAAVEATDSREVRTQSFYRYRDKQDVTRYYFRKWGGWSEFRDEKVSGSDTREVQVRTIYRYKPK